MNEKRIMRKIIDFHTHAFPDTLADKAMAQLHSELHCELYGVKDLTAYLDGRVGSLLASMDRAGIDASVLCCIATRPSQFEQILSWCKQIRSDRIIPLPSVHPDDTQVVEKIDRIATEGFKGLKFHPYYQDFDLDSPQMDPIYEAISQNNMLVVMHTGYDIAFERIDRAGPKRVLNVIARFPQLKLITTHMGAWYDWDEVERQLLGKPIYMDISVSRQFLDEHRFRKLLLNHPSDYILFGSDSPWADQHSEIQAIGRLDLPEKFMKKLFYENAMKLLAP
jgi:predicted TIM-barrel fold metal-dependent hydrolase